MIDFPIEFLNSMQQILGDQYQDFLSSLNQPEQKAIFVNQNKISVPKFLSLIDFSTQKIEYENCGFYTDNIKLGRHVLHHAGAFYVQEPSAMFTVNSHAFTGDELVLDMCSAPGGKSIQLANRLPNGFLVSNEYNKTRSEILFSNIERMGLKNVIITNDTPEHIAKAYANTFDVCLVDAPCSGEGMFRRGEDVVSTWNSGTPIACSSRQLDILSEADKALKQGGFLIYSTCTYSLEENEQVVKSFMADFGYEIVNIDAPFSRGIDLPQAVRLYPHIVKGEGQFVAVLHKLSPNENMPKSTLKLQQSTIAKTFLQSNFNLDITPYEHKGSIYFTPNINLLKKDVNYVSLGVRLGCVEKDRFVPAHNLFTAFGNNAKIVLDYPLDADQVKSYLHGDSFAISCPDGFGCLSVCGLTLGGFKAVNGMLKNYYPKGLRNFK